MLAAGSEFRNCTELDQAAEAFNEMTTLSRLRGKPNIVPFFAIVTGGKNPAWRPVEIQGCNVLVRAGLARVSPIN